LYIYFGGIINNIIKSEHAVKILMAAFLLFLYIPFAFSAGLGWVLNGNIISASTCLPVPNANISSAYNSNASNISSASGAYLLVLGTGNWTIFVKASGYYSEQYATPFITNGGLTHYFALLPINSKVSNCWKNISNITGPSFSTPQNISNVSVPPQVTNKSKNITSANSISNKTSSTNNNLIMIVVIIIIIAIILFMKKRHKKESIESNSPAQ
jgi:hypothetical protein